MSDCVFCQIVAGESWAAQVYQDERAIGIVPLAPVTFGHVLAIPRRHAKDFTEDWLATSDAMHAAFQIARIYGGPCNLITSKGPAATQSIFHLHVHVVPRTDDDGLALPWHSGRSAAVAS
jgi:histidine triad (HIT) family protein